MPDDLRLTFDAVAESYGDARPSYPAAAFDALFEYLQYERPPRAPSILEIGPGTGQATRDLLARGAHVTAVELGPNLARVLRREFATHERLTVVNASFEDAPVPLHTFDAVFAATSFHWLDPAIRTERVSQLLVSGGVAATISTVQVQSEIDRGYFERTHPIYERYRPGEPFTVAPRAADVTTPEAAEFAASEAFAGVEVLRYPWDQRYTTDQYEALLRSYSDTQAMPPGPREALIADLRTVIDTEYDGYVIRPLVIALTLARRR